MDNIHERIIGPLSGRLGMVIRFTPKAASAGVRNLEGGGFKIATTSDFRSARSVPNDFGGADVQFFERFGIAIVRHDPDRLGATLRNAYEQNIVASSRREREYRALGGSSIGPNQSGIPGANSASADYWLGYRDGITALVDQLTVANRKGGATAEAIYSEDISTWGLLATKGSQCTLTGAGIKVAVLDTGFDDAHPDFKGRSITRKLFATASSQDDKIGHGTHCIGTACGPFRPLSGPRYGIAHEAEIYAGKVLGDDGYGSDRSIIAGMEWALDQGCEIISMSLGAPVNIGEQPVTEYEHIGKVCLDDGTLVIAAAGNESRRPSQIAAVGSPANASTIMAVAAVDRDMRVARFSCGGVNAGQEIDICAPGVDILSSLPGGKYDRWQGTSMATPHVAGVAALIAQSDPRYRGWALWARLIQLSQRLNLPTRDVGAGFLQAPSN